MIFQYYGIRTIILSRLEIEFTNAPVSLSELGSLSLDLTPRHSTLHSRLTLFQYPALNFFIQEFFFCTFGFIVVTCSHSYNIESNRITSHHVISHRTALRDIARPANLIVGWRFFLHFSFLCFPLFFSFHFFFQLGLQYYPDPSLRLAPSKPHYITSNHTTLHHNTLNNCKQDFTKNPFTLSNEELLYNFSLTFVFLHH